MIRRPPRSTRTDTLFPYTTLFRSFENTHMGVTAENVAKKYSISRDEQDALALLSHQRAEAAITQGYFKEQIVPIVQKTRRGDVIFDTDEHVRMGANAENFSKLKPVFIKENGTVTAGNATGLNKGTDDVHVIR